MDNFLAVCPSCDHTFPIDLDCVSMEGGCEIDPSYDTMITCPECEYSTRIA